MKSPGKDSCSETHGDRRKENEKKKEERGGKRKTKEKGFYKAPS